MLKVRWSWRRHAHLWGTILVVWDSWLQETAQTGVYSADEKDFLVPSGLPPQQQQKAGDASAATCYDVIAKKPQDAHAAALETRLQQESLAKSTGHKPTTPSVLPNRYSWLTHPSGQKQYVPLPAAF